MNKYFFIVAFVVLADSTKASADFVNPFELLQKCYDEKSHVQVQLNQCVNDLRRISEMSCQISKYLCVLDASGLGKVYIGQKTSKIDAQEDAKDKCLKDTFSSNCDQPDSFRCWSVYSEE